MRLYRQILLITFAVVSLIGFFQAVAQVPAPAPAPVPAPASTPAPVPEKKAEDPALKLTDPRTLLRLADEARDAGRAEEARALYERAVSQQELAIYFKYGKALREALILEHLQDWAGAEALYRKNAERDIHYTIMALRVASQHPQRDQLVSEFVGKIREMAERVKAGDKEVVFYVTSKDEPRYLEYIPEKDVLTRLWAWNKGDESQRLRYCYIDKVDLRDVPSEALPPKIQFSQCIIGEVAIPDKDIAKFAISGFVLGNFDVGKTWAGEVNKSQSFPASRFQEITTRDTVFLGRANFQDIRVSGRKAAFPLTIFEGIADYRGATFAGMTDFRFSVFGEGANFRGARAEKTLYFGESRFRKDTTFTGLYSEREVFFNSVRFEAPVRFDTCEWRRSATFENSTFEGATTFSSSKVGGRLNMSRAVFEAPLEMREVQLGGMDLFGTELRADTRFTDANFSGKVRFSLDDNTRARHLADVAPLLGLYRDYQGDEDAEEPIATGASYGVTSVDDLIAKVLGNLSFANSVFRDFCIFERVQFGLPDKDTLAEFYNTQFGGETHFERTRWYATADFTTIYGQELAMNEAIFHKSLILDDANIPGRVTMTDATFEGDATLSFYGAQIGTFQVDRVHVDDEATGIHRLWYEQCALNGVPRDDLRVARQFLGETPDEAALKDYQVECFARAIDEYISLKQSFGDRAMTSDEDWAYWWIKHYETRASVIDGGLLAWLAWPIRFFIFELAFGWGVRLGNLAITALVVCLVFVVVYRAVCPDTVMQYNGDAVRIRDIPWHGMFYISLQSLGAFNTGWDFNESDPRFRYLNTLHTYMGVLIMTFFVGAYTRMILA